MPRPVFFNYSCTPIERKVYALMQVPTPIQVLFSDREKWLGDIELHLKCEGRMPTARLSFRQRKDAGSPVANICIIAGVYLDGELCLLREHLGTDLEVKTVVGKEEAINCAMTDLHNRLEKMGVGIRDGCYQTDW